MDSVSRLKIIIILYIGKYLFHSYPLLGGVAGLFLLLHYEPYKITI